MPPPPPPVFDVAQTDAGALPPPRPPPKPEVTAAIFERGPGAWTNAFRFGGKPPAELARPCYARALEIDPDVAGWLRVEIVMSMSETHTKLVTSTVPATLSTCIVDALRGVTIPDGMTSFDAIVYVSLTSSQ